MKTSIVLDKVTATQPNIIFTIGIFRTCHRVRVNCVSVRSLDGCGLGNVVTKTGFSLEPIGFPVDRLKSCGNFTVSLGGNKKFRRLSGGFCLRLCISWPERACRAIQANIPPGIRVEMSTSRAIRLISIIDLGNRPGAGVAYRPWALSFFLWSSDPGLRAD